MPDGPAALAVLADRLKPGDAVLVKASRAVRLEGVADMLLAPVGPPPGDPQAPLGEEADR